MKKKLFSLLAVMLMTLAANAQKTITWDYNTIKGIDFDINDYVEDDIVIPIISKNGITLSYNWGDKPSELYFKDCNLGIDFNSSYYDSNTLNFISTVGNITSIAITCSDGENALWDEEYYGWTTSKTSITWHGDPAHTVEMPFADNSEITGITQIVFTVDDADTPTYTISDIPDGWKVNGSTTNGTCEVKVGAMVIFTPANIPAGKKINSVSFVEATSSKYTSQLFEKSDGTWVLGIMPNYDGKLVVVYKDNDNPVTKHTIYNIPDGWKVNGSTTSGTYKAEEGAEVIFTPANIPAGKKIKSIKVVKQ